ncbi:hypothetical protein THAOC_25568 [Thalassiosira oceanica]|uniref:Uncharacterized protein n=1 Tax=Thalassiosira oceanica TaxID=159749 RepID=K0RNZ9_THAOC|nr:hypothetical protein THAOC_25568 [Thalassiosira oceanica]|eukprot:EJK54775.1 hypothetical protein THAOC_25568 [Thalassiosira oceanica]
MIPTSPRIGDMTVPGIGVPRGQLGGWISNLVMARGTAVPGLADTIWQGHGGPRSLSPLGPGHGGPRTLCSSSPLGPGHGPGHGGPRTL